MDNRVNNGMKPVRNVADRAKNEDISGSNVKTDEHIYDKAGLKEVLSCLSKPQREKFISGYDIKKFAKIFEDEEMMRTVDAFLENGMNASETSRALYMHRNTLAYRLNSIRRQTGLDLKNFEMAVTFKILHILYTMK